MTTTPEISIGDRVQLVSGGPEMTVENIYADHAAVVWFDEDSDVVREVFPAAGLKRSGRLRVVGRETG